MEKRTLFEAGDFVVTFTGHVGLVLSCEELGWAKERCKEGQKPGRFFAPGCCANPDYVTQVPVLFEDGTYNVMKAMNIRKKSSVPEEQKDQIRKTLRRESLPP